MTKRPSPKPLLPLVSPLPRLRHLAALSGCLAWLRLFRSAGHMVGDLAAERTTFVAKIRRLRWASFLLGSWNIGVVVLGCFLMVYLLSGCSAEEKLPFAASTMIAGIRVFAMVGTGKAQQETAEIIVSCPTDSATVDSVVRNDRRLRYKRWLCWTRFGMAVTVLQFLGAIYLMFIVLTDISYGGRSTSCFLGQDTVNQAWKKTLVVSFLLLVWLVIIIQCFTGSDVLRWRSFYSTHDTAWKAHYREVFDHGIREALCCLGHVKSVLEEDEVYSVARLLGDLVAYRASGTGHLELLIGLALLQSHKQMQNLHDELLDAPDILVQKAAFFHQFAEAAYTTKREAAYFVVVLHDKKAIVIAIRGTETPEDLITDGLCRECTLTVEDLDDASPSETSGFLSSLLGPGSECYGYEVNIVGHSLGGAIATLLGLRLYRRYPNLHVYAYGTLPCVDFVIAEACTDFVTTIVYNDEFSARLSVNSILRLRSAAINALSDDSLADSAIIQKFARRILHVNRYLEDGQNHNVSASSVRSSLAATEKNHVSKRRPFKPITVSAQMNQDLYLEDSSLFDDDASETQVLVDCDVWRANSCGTVSSKDTCLIMDQMTQFVGDQPSSTQLSVEPPEMFLPGCIVHIVREPKGVIMRSKEY
ncbi:Lipase (class 3) [Musa troglodytarum]|uniref:Lipase (Class 3) n=1 Tax=Musa troglodytarum TaxID=320322 RepID=A0A9E7L9G3_9LILI|nr:Lipase (class 3) [Musa troglodytarum]